MIGLLCCTCCLDSEKEVESEIAAQIEFQTKTAEKATQTPEIIVKEEKKKSPKSLKQSVSMSLPVEINKIYAKESSFSSNDDWFELSKESQEIR